MPTTPTREQLVRAGRELARLMNTDAMDRAVELLKADYTSRIVNSDYADKAGREEAYKMLRSLDDLLSVVNTLIFAAERDLLDAEDDN